MNPQDAARVHRSTEWCSATVHVIGAGVITCQKPAGHETNYALGRLHLRSRSGAETAIWDDKSSVIATPRGWIDDAGEDALQRGAEMGEAFAGLGRKIPGGADDRRVGPSGQSSEGAAVVSGNPPVAPSGPDPAARLAKAFVEAVRRLGNPEISPAAVETVLAEDIRKALESYK